MKSICEAIKEFEDECGRDMENGREVAEQSNAAFDSDIENAAAEPYFTTRLLNALQNLRRNYVKVLISPEKHTGTDIEIHVLHPIGSWTGLRIQAKRAKYMNAGFGFPDLNRSPKAKPEDPEPPLPGEQNHKLIANAINAGMIPLYLYYLPNSLVREWEGRSGAMVGSAWDAQNHIANRTFGARTVLNRNTYPLSHLLCPLDYNLTDFTDRVGDLYSPHVEDRTYDADLSQDIEDRYPGSKFEEMEESVWEDTGDILVKRTPPDKILSVFDAHGSYEFDENVCGAAFINLRDAIR